MEELEEEKCEHCGGTGEVSYDEQDRDGNWQRGVGTRACECKLIEEDYSNDDEE